MEETLSYQPGSALLTRVQAYAGAVALVAVSTLVGLWIAPRWGQRRST